MSIIRNKLRQKNGASIFMGLIFLLVCMMVGSVALTASTAASGKLAQQKQNEQDYLTVASAARLVKNRICKLTYEHVKVDDNSPSVTLEASDSGTVILSDELKKLCGILAENMGSDTLQSDLDAAGAAFQISLTPAAGVTDVKWETVHGRLDMDSRGKITVKLWLGDAAIDNLQNHNHMKIEFSPDGPVKNTVVDRIETTEADGTITVTVKRTVTTTCRWPEVGCTIKKGK